MFLRRSRRNLLPEFQRRPSSRLTGNHRTDKAADSQWTQIPSSVIGTPEFKKGSFGRLVDDPKPPRNYPKYDGNNHPGAKVKPYLPPPKGKHNSQGNPLTKHVDSKNPISQKQKDDSNKVGPSNVKSSSSFGDKHKSGSTPTQRNVDDRKPQSNQLGNHGGSRVAPSNVKSSSSFGDKHKSGSTPTQRNVGDGKPQSNQLGNHGGSRVAPSNVKSSSSFGDKHKSGSTPTQRNVGDGKVPTHVPNKKKVRFEEPSKPSVSSPNENSDFSSGPVLKGVDDRKPQAHQSINNGGNKVPRSILKRSPSSAIDKRETVPFRGPQLDEDKQTPTNKPSTTGENVAAASNGRPSPSDPKGKRIVGRFEVQPALDDTQLPTNTSKSCGKKVGAANGNPTPSSPKEKVITSPSTVQPAFDDTQPPTNRLNSEGGKRMGASNTKPLPSPSPTKVKPGFTSDSVPKHLDEGRFPVGKPCIPGNQITAPGTTLPAGYSKEMFDFEFIPMGNLHDKGDPYSSPHEERRFQIFDVRKLIEDDNIQNQNIKVGGKNAVTILNPSAPSPKGRDELQNIIPVIPLTDAHIPLRPDQEKPTGHYLLVPKVEDNTQNTNMVGNVRGSKVSDAATQTSPSLPKKDGKIIPIDVKSFIEDTKAATSTLGLYSGTTVSDAATQTPLSNSYGKGKINPSRIVPPVDVMKPETGKTGDDGQIAASNRNRSPSSPLDNAEVKRFPPQPLVDGAQPQANTAYKKIGSFEGLASKSPLSGEEREIDSFLIQKIDDDKKLCTEEPAYEDMVDASDVKPSPSSGVKPKSEPTPDDQKPQTQQPVNHGDTKSEPTPDDQKPQTQQPVNHGDTKADASDVKPSPSSGVKPKSEPTPDDRKPRQDKPSDGRKATQANKKPSMSLSKAEGKCEPSKDAESVEGGKASPLTPQELRHFVIRGVHRPVDENESPLPCSSCGKNE
ncbi:RNA pseudouridine synthase, putative [Babesia ovata]|uniref:RNA pseudouridine synthase, putative n=1 Tax=Babesia ovata TaxID=189622 RepID=A0A2H6KEH6_9APIC|nr:RNA pseudouridine synthase, putative [Babesia ovata]GBE61359.1 RNA pseudouridine synthase, putative [Babesia ovata]